VIRVLHINQVHIGYPYAESRVSNCAVSGLSSLGLGGLGFLAVLLVRVKCRQSCGFGLVLEHRVWLSDVVCLVVVVDRVLGLEKKSILEVLVF
jgi:hypothetical protein